MLKDYLSDTPRSGDLEQSEIFINPRENKSFLNRSPQRRIEFMDIRNLYAHLQRRIVKYRKFDHGNEVLNLLFFL